MEDAVTTPVWYAALDEAVSPVRIRLNSTVVRVLHKGEPRKASEVEVTYVRDGGAYRVRGGTSVLACYNSMIPICVPSSPRSKSKRCTCPCGNRSSIRTWSFATGRPFTSSA